MRVVTWNLGYWKPAHYKSVENRQRQWALLAALAPDIALLQECRPDDLLHHAPEWMSSEYESIGAIPHRWQACSAILVRTSLEAVAMDHGDLPVSEARWLGYLSGYVAGARVVVDGTSISVASVHTIAREVDDPAVTTEDHDQIRRRALKRAWHNDLAVAALSPWLQGGHFLVGGDWNNALLFDTTYPSGAEGGVGASAEFFSSRGAAGWHHALRKFNPVEVRTYMDPSSHPYELDHVFTDRDLHDRLTGCRVVDDPAFARLSDHAPLVLDID